MTVLDWMTISVGDRIVEKLIKEIIKIISDKPTYEVKKIHFHLYYQ